MNVPDNRPDKLFEQRARALWLDASRHIDPVTTGRLRAARRQALEAAHAPRRHGVRWLIPTGAFAVIALATLMVWQPLPRHAATPAGHVAGMGADMIDSELPPDADKTDPTLYQNLDFYGWLASSGGVAATH